VGQTLSVQAALYPASLRPTDVAVELVYGHAQDGNLMDARVLPMIPNLESADGQINYQVDFTSPDSGHFAYGVRARPQHTDLPNPFAVYLACWA
jgi:starch phosphorylase